MRRHLEQTNNNDNTLGYDKCQLIFWACFESIKARDELGLPYKMQMPLPIWISNK